MLLTGIDWLAIGLFFAALFGIALVCSKRAGRDAKDFFLSGRSMPWWLIGVSMCAASTSTNSANMFTEFIRNSGLSENWKWWAFLLSGILTVFVYSKLWVRSGAKSDIEFYELRYSGRAAAFLRGFRSLYLGIVFNVITTGLVMLAAIKFGQVLFGVDQWTVIVVTAICSIVYSALGGFRGAIYTDFFLFVLIMVGGERVVLLGIPEDVLADDFARGEKAGTQSSRLWAAETQQSRLGLIRSLLERAAGSEPDFPASGWRSTYHTEQHVAW